MVTAVVSGGGRFRAVQAYVGSSVGALNAAYAAGQPDAGGARRLAEIWTMLRRPDVFPTEAVRVLRAMVGRTTGLAAPHALRRLVRRHLNYARLENAPWQVVVVATDVLSGQEVALGQGPAVDAVMARAALPSVFPSMNVGSRLLMDGGVVKTTPISVARQLGADTIYVLPTARSLPQH
jgi:NTE family protein